MDKKQQVHFWYVALALAAMFFKDLEAGTKILLEKETITPEEFPPLLQAKERMAAE